MDEWGSYVKWFTLHRFVLCYKKWTFLVHHNAISNNIQVAIYVYHCQNSKVWRKQEFQRNRNEVHNATLAL